MDEYTNDETSDDFSELEDSGEKMDESDDFEVDVESGTSSDRHDVLDGDTVVDAKAEMERLYEEVMDDLEEDVRGTEAEVTGMENELKQLKAEKSSLKKEARGHKKKTSRLNSELRKQKRMLGYIDRQQRLREFIENYKLGPNEVFMDEDEFEDLDAAPSSETEERIKKREKKAYKAAARHDALEKTLQDLEETGAAIAQADIVAEEAEIDIFLMGLHAGNMQKIIEDAPAEKSRARQDLDAIQNISQHYRLHFEHSLIRPNPRLARVLYKLGKRSGSADDVPPVTPAIAAQSATQMLASANAAGGCAEDPVAKDPSKMGSKSVAQRFKSFIESRKKATAYGAARR